MRLARLMVWKELAHMRADPLTMRLMIAPVFLQIFVLGYALVTEIKHTPVTVLDQCRTPQSQEVVNAIRRSDLFVFRPQAQTRDEVRARMDAGEVRIALVIPPDFSRMLQRREGAALQMLVDGQDANASIVAGGYMNAIVRTWSMQQLSRTVEKAGGRVADVMPVQVSPVVLFNPMLKSTWYMIPALVALLITMVTALLSGFSIVREKDRGTLEQLMVTPLLPIHVIIGKTVPYALVGLAELCVFLVLAKLWFGIPFLGSLWVLALFAVLYMISSLGIGILASTVARSPGQVLFLIWFIMIFFILLSGFFIPVENAPHWVQNITYVNPMRFFMFALREIFLKGSGLRELWREACIMAAIGVVVLGAAVALFQRRAA